MNKWTKRLAAIAMALTMVVSVAFAEDTPIQIDTADTPTSVPVELTVEAAVFSVTVPSSLPVTVDANGVVTCANNAYIINLGSGAVVVTNITIQGLNDWVSVDWDSCNMKAEQVGAKKFACMINNQKTTGANQFDEFNSANFPSISGADPDSEDDQLLITYSFQLPAQSTALTDVAIANIVFTIGWDTLADDSGD